MFSRSIEAKPSRFEGNRMNRYTLAAPFQLTTALQ
jgi:hypothetical protein